MLVRGIVVAASLIAGAALTLELTGGEAAVPRDGGGAAEGTMGLAPISIGNPHTAAALASLDTGRPIITGGPQAGPEEGGTPDVPEITQATFTVKSGDTLARILQRAGIDNETAHAAISALKGVYDPRDLRAGQAIVVLFAPDAGHQDDGHGSGRFAGFQVPLDYATDIHVAAAPEGGYRAQKVKKALETRPTRAEGVITWSLFAAGAEAGLPSSVMTELVRAFSWDVDFQRDIRKNDRFEVLYERQVDEHGRTVHNGRILFAALTLSGQRKAIYRHQMADGTWDYFDEKGQSAKKALMRTPIDGARLSSHFGNRKHPILGYTKKHTGTDFAAPPGTPIYAAGDGVIDYAGWKGGYGKYIRIRHNSEYSTAYAHMRAFKKGIAKGRRVKQGDVIGYVGTTGQSTGPHLHYEVIRRGVKVNPMRVTMPSGKKLTGQELARFEATRSRLDTLWASLPSQGPQLAQR